MKILKLVAENFKRLRAVDITPESNIVTISGRNAQGKTSILDAIWAALAGAKHIQSEPMRKGAKKGKIRLEMGNQSVELVIERKFTEGGPAKGTLTVTTAEGYTPPGGAQAVLDALIGALCFDPLAFTRMDRGDQFSELREIVHLEIDLEQMDKQNAADYERRRQLNAEAKQLRARAAVPVDPGLPAESIDEDALLEQMELASQTNSGIDSEQQRRERVAFQIDVHRGAVATILKEIEALHMKANEREKLADDTARDLAALDPLPLKVDVSAIRLQLGTAKQTNAAIETRNAVQRIAKQEEEIEATTELLTESIKARDEAKREALAAAKFPVPGLGFGEGIVTYNDLPFDQASSAEQLRVSLAIAMESNPKLRVIRIEDGSLLDSDSLAAIQAMAEEHDYQIWMEVVDSSGLLGIVIEDGTVATDAERRAMMRAELDVDHSENDE